MAAETLLALWNDTPSRRAIVDFVQAVSTEGSPGFVAPAERVARTGGREALRLLVLHDDADREFAYTTGAEGALDRAKTHGWTVVSMKEDWSAVFASA
jgi:hypothetical protein